MNTNFSIRKVMAFGLLTLTAAAGGPAAAGALLTPDEALLRARMQQRTIPAQAKAQVQNINISAEPVYTVSANAEQPAAYVFLNADKSGYMILSASDLAAPVLGYSDSGTFDPHNIPVNMQEWLDGYAAQIAAAEASGIKDNGLGYLRRKSADYAAIPPMVKTLWNQDEPFNDLCPTINGRRSVTGCLATAEAQVLNYFQYPKKGTGTISYTWSSGRTTLSCDFDTIPLDWDNMANDYSAKANTTTEQKLAVANLMYACGMASQMDYSPSSSGANAINGSTGMYTYLGCTQAGVTLGDWYNPDELNEFVYNYLQENGPLVYCGQSSSGGHAFVCDGYRGDGYFHFNWGWGGMSDGYFKLNALNPGSQGIGGSSSGYNSSQQLMVGLHAPKDIADWKPIMGADGGMTISSDWNGVLGDTVMVESTNEDCGFYNFSVGTIKVTYGLEYMRNATGEKTFIACYGIIDRELPGFRGWRSYPVEIPKDLEEGTYNVYAAYRANGGEWTRFPADQNFQTFTLATVTGDSIMFEKPKPADILISDIDFETELYAGGGFRLTAKAQGTGDRDFYGNVALVLGEYYGDDFAADFQGSNVLIGAKPAVESEFTYTGTFTNQRLKGKYKLVFVVPETGKIVSEPIEVTIKPYPGAAPPTSTNPVIKNASAVNPNDVMVSADVTSEGGYFSSNLYLAIGTVENDAFSMIQRFESPILYILPGETQHVEFGGAISATDGEILTAQLQYYVAAKRKYIQIGDNMTFTVKTSGVEDITTDHSDAPAEYFNLNGIKVSREDLQPGTYIMRQGAKAEKVIVK